MIISLFGQPHSGKTTLAELLMKDSRYSDSWNIDGDKLRELFRNKNYSREGRIQNLNRASDIAHFLNSTTSKDVILSLVYPYEETRNYLNSLSGEVKWIYLSYKGERGREGFHVQDFEVPADGDVLKLDTSITSTEDCLTIIKKFIS